MIIVFSNSKIIGSHLIRMFSPSKYKHSEKASHVAIISYWNIMLESVAGHGTRLNWFATFLKKNKAVCAFDVMGFEDHVIAWIAFKDLVEENHGKKYDYFGVLWFVAYFALRRFGIKLKRNNWHKKNKVFCNELLYPITKLELSTMTPEDLRAYLESEEGQKIAKRIK